MESKFGDRLVYWASGEFLLKQRSNGGTVVFLRSCIVTVLLIAAVLPAKSYFSKDSTFVFSASQLKIEIGDLIPWAGAVFAAAYAALYARFSAQWNYLASLYNQIAASSLAMPYDTSRTDPRMHGWRAAFVEDAIDLHLAGKSMFSGAIKYYLSEDKAAFDAFVQHTNDARGKIRRLEKQLGFAAFPIDP